MRMLVNIFSLAKLATKTSLVIVVGLQLAVSFSLNTVVKWKKNEVRERTAEILEANTRLAAVLDKYATHFDAADREGLAQFDTLFILTSKLSDTGARAKIVQDRNDSRVNLLGIPLTSGEILHLLDPGSVADASLQLAHPKNRKLKRYCNAVKVDGPDTRRLLDDLPARVIVTENEDVIGRWGNELDNVLQRIAEGVYTGNENARFLYDEISKHAQLSPALFHREKFDLDQSYEAMNFVESCLIFETMKRNKFNLSDDQKLLLVFHHALFEDKELYQDIRTRQTGVDNRFKPSGFDLINSAYYIGVLGALNPKLEKKKLLSYFESLHQKIHNHSKVIYQDNSSVTFASSNYNLTLLSFRVRMLMVLAKIQIGRSYEEITNEIRSLVEAMQVLEEGAKKQRQLSKDELRKISAKLSHLQSMLFKLQNYAKDTQLKAVG